MPSELERAIAEVRAGTVAKVDLQDSSLRLQMMAIQRAPVVLNHLQEGAGLQHAGRFEVRIVLVEEDLEMCLRLQRHATVGEMLQAARTKRRAEQAARRVSTQSANQREQAGAIITHHRMETVGGVARAAASAMKRSWSRKGHESRLACTSSPILCLIAGCRSERD